MSCTSLLKGPSDFPENEGEVAGISVTKAFPVPLGRLSLDDTSHLDQIHLFATSFKDRTIWNHPDAAIRRRGQQAPLQGPVSIPAPRTPGGKPTLSVLYCVMGGLAMA